MTIGPTLTSDMPGITCNGDATIVIWFELGADGKVVIYTPEVKNGASAFRLSVIAADDVGFTENVVEYPLDTDGETTIDEIDTVNRFFRIVAEPKW